MPGDIELHLKEDMDLTGALVIVGTPTLGLVGTITARYLTQAMDMTLLGGMHSDQFPPSIVVHDGKPLHPIRVHAVETKCGLDLKCDKIVVMTSETFLEPRILWPVGRKIVKWCKQIDAEMVIVPDAIRPQKEEESDLLRGIASTPNAREFLERSDVEPLKHGLIMGVSAALLSTAEHEGLDLVSLLSESSPDHPDARAAARVVSLMDRVIPDIHIESKPLLEEAEQIEAMVREMREDMKAHQSANNPTQETSMFS